MIQIFMHNSIDFKEITFHREKIMIDLTFTRESCERIRITRTLFPLICVFSVD